MKIFQYLLKISLALTLVAANANASRAQSGNMSDKTVPETMEMIPDKITSPSNPSDNANNYLPPQESDPAINPSPNSDPSGEPSNADPQTDSTVPPTTAEEVPQDSQQNQANPPNQDGQNSPGEGETTDSSNLETDSQNGADSSGESETADNSNLEEDSQDGVDSSDESATDANTEEKSETDPKSEEEDVAKKEDETEKKLESAPQQEVNRIAYEAQIQDASTDIAVQLHEEFQVTQLVSSSGVQLYGDIPSVGQISDRLGQLWQQTGKKPAFINVSVQSNQLETFVVLPTVKNIAARSNSVVNLSKDDSKTELKTKDATPTEEVIRETVKYSSRKEILAIAKQFREEVSNSRNIGKSNYLESAQKLYQSIVKPLEAELEDDDIDILVFSMDSGLRLIPLAALHDGEQFLVEKYAIALVPSFGLTDTRYVTINQSPILAMGASEFEDQAPLPTMSLELRNITRNPRQGEIFLNEEFTVNNFIAQNRRRDPFRIIHLGTHAQFKAGNFADSFIQFSDRKLKLPELRRISDELGWSTNNDAPIELLVLSACETALGDEESELGFAGLAVQAGVKSALASLWYISDLGTLALMSEFYDNLSNTLVKAEALRATQLSMLKGEVKVKDRKLLLSNGESISLPSTFPQGSLTLADPYFWSAFTLIGNWN